MRWQIRRTTERLRAGEYRRALAMPTDNATLAFPGDNTWANQHRPTVKGRDRFATHRGRDEIEAFLHSYVEFGFHMEVEDILVNGWPWRTRAAVRVRHWASGPTGEDSYTNRAVLFVDTTWGCSAHRRTTRTPSASPSSISSSHSPTRPPHLPARRPADTPRRPSARLTPG